MKFTAKFVNTDKLPATALILAITEQGKLSPIGKHLNKTSQEYLSQLVKKGDFQAKPAQTLLLQQVPGLAAAPVLLVGCGKDLSLNERDYRKAIIASIKTLQQTSATQVISFLNEIEIEKRDLAWKTQFGAQFGSEALYQFEQFKSEKSAGSKLKEFVFAVTDKKNATTLEKALTQGCKIAAGVEFTKNLANMPSNICTPSYLATQAKNLAKTYKSIAVKVLEEKDMRKLGMGALLAVAQGSAQDAKLICLEYKGTAKKQAPIALVGKGITFDTGGVSLKPSDSMVGMKYDMCGAATVLGTIKTIADLKLPIHVVGLVASAENMPGGKAYKPEDIVTSMSGQTIEIMNTDAEGRLVLCDALTYCERYKPEAVIDIATLTGAVVVALGFHATGLLANNEALCKELLDAGNESFDRAWPLPLWDEYQEQLRSPFADMSNVGGRSAGTITAACFLSRFAKKFPWAHLDVAGTAAMMMGNDRYATGRPVPMLVQYLMNKCKK